ncbi:MAG: hypothetical protein NZ455_14335 [Bacteroidia bacterium]|nr:hypothetical protein [Bacteroidia bacterium]
MGVTLRVCPQGRRATGYAFASVLRFAAHRADARPPHASRKQLWTKLIYVKFNLVNI